MSSVQSPRFFEHSAKFQGSAAGLLLRQAPAIPRLLGSAVRMQESAHGLSHLTFLQDTLVAWLPKSLVSRSQTELSEITFLEFLESFLIYYSIPLLGGKILKPLFHRLAASKAAGGHFERALLSTPLKELSPSQLRRVLPAKAAIILATIGLSVFSGEYVINYTKNLLTARIFKKDRFSDVVNLSQGELQANDTSPVAEKARRRIKQCLALSAGILAASVLLARFGGRVLALEKPLAKLVQTFDFRFQANGGYGLSRNQMLAYMALAMPSYLDAARDNLERVEVVTRLAIILPYLAFGQTVLQKLLLKLGRKRFPQIVNASGQAKSLEHLAQEALKKAERKVAFSGVRSASTLLQTRDDLVKNAAKAFLPGLRGKNFLFAVPLAVGILGTGIGVGLLNRFWTATRFRQQQESSSEGTRSQDAFAAYLHQVHQHQMAKGHSGEVQAM